MLTDHYRFSNINILICQYRFPLKRFAIGWGRDYSIDSNNSKSFYFGYTWFVGSAHPTPTTQPTKLFSNEIDR
jgi:hypothetical protein